VTFQEFAAARLPAVLAFAAVLTGQRATAEDIAQEVLIRAYARWDTIGGLDRPEFYVRKMVLNEFLSWRRRSWRLIPAGDAAAAAEITSDHADEYAERTALLAEIGKLPRRQRAVLVLRYYEDRSDAEIARDAFCPMQSLPTAGYLGSNTAFLTPDGTRFIATVPHPIPIGQRPPACTQISPPRRATMPELEEFSVRTGRATRVLYASGSHGAEASDVYWSSPAGSVLVVESTLKPGVKSPTVFGILSGSTFTPIPGSSSPPLIPQLAF
jgi:RNA polymerase sigma factor (sigma-70 family)